MKGLTREMERTQRIRSIQNSLVQAQEKGIKIDKAKLLVQTQIELGVVQSKALEYIDLAAAACDYQFE